MIADGVYTVVNPRTGGHRTYRIIHCQDEQFKGYWKNLGELTRIAEYLVNGKWRGIAFIHPTNDGQVRVWSKQAHMLAEVAGLKWLVKHGAGREGELTTNFEAFCRMDCNHEPRAADPIQDIEVIAKQRWDGV
jgi:hypothetical protein